MVYTQFQPSYDDTARLGYDTKRPNSCEKIDIRKVYTGNQSKVIKKKNRFRFIYFGVSIS